LTLWAEVRGWISRAIGSERSGLVQRLTPYTVPPRRGSAELLKLYRLSPWLRSAAGKTGDAVASVPIRLYRVDAKGARVEVTKHPVLDLLRKPCAGLDGMALRKVASIHYDLNGDAILVKERNRGGQVIGLLPIPPHWVRTFPSRTGDRYLLSHRNATASIDPADVIRVQDPDPDEPFGRGTGIGEALSDEIDTDEYAAQYVKTWFANFGAPGMMVSVEGVSPDILARVEAQYRADHQGPGKAHLPMFTSGKTRVERLDTSFREANLVGVRDQQRDVIVSVWGVPPEILGILTSSNRATIEGAEWIMGKFVVTPRMNVVVNALNTQLLPEFGEDDLVFGYDSPVPADKVFTLEVMQARPTAFTDNEVRALGGLAAVKGKDEFPEPMTFGPALAGDPEFTRHLPQKRAPADGGTASPEHAKNALEALRPERLTYRVEPEYLATLEAWGKRALEKIGAAPKFDILNPLFAPYVAEQSTTKITGYVDETTRSTLRASLEEGVRQGESIRDLRDRVEDVFDAADQTRAEAIARTEVVGAANWATTQAHKVSGVVSEREWVATRDGRARETHLEMDGQKVAIDKKFTSPSGATADCPGSFGVAEEDIQCRCTTVAVIDDPPDDSEDAVGRDASTEKLDVVWRAFDGRLKPDERRFAKALRRGFADQRGDVLAALSDSRTHRNGASK